ncbi:cell adhesion molecule 2-like [Antedon mediterranea]|uniref:cell adhesion molecule 2-like n=1 Tax=Antedon mediterranea TaxID=105859 RepID=UPI003AF8788F
MLLTVLSYIFLFFNITNCLVFDKQPSNSTVKAKGAVLLICIVEFDTTITSQYKLKWKKDGEYIAINDVLREDLKTSQNFIVTINEDNMQIIYNIFFYGVLNSDRGFYQCDVFENSSLVLESNKAFLDVIQIPDDKYPLCTESKDVYTEGDDVMLFCVSEYTEPPVTLRWNDGATHVVEIVDGESARLQKRLIADPDLNGYKSVCSMTNEHIPDLNRNCTTQPLTIYYKPRVSIRQTGLISAGKQGFFICETTANPAVTRYTWLTLPPLDKTEYNIDNTGHIFMLSNPTMKQDGTVVTCTAENRIGSSSTSVTLSIQSDTQKDVRVTSAQDSVIINYNENNQSRGNNTVNKETSTGLSTDVIVIIIVACVVLLVIIVMIPVYYYCLCSKNITTNQTTTIVHQPEVYFEPRDRMTLPLPRTRDATIWRRSFAAQAPDDKEVDAMYLEIQSNHYIYAATSRCNTMR